MGFPKWNVLIGRAGFDTIPSIPDPTLSLTSVPMTWRAISARPYATAGGDELLMVRADVELLVGRVEVELMPFIAEAGAYTRPPLSSS